MAPDRVRPVESISGTVSCSGNSLYCDHSPLIRVLGKAISRQHSASGGIGAGALIRKSKTVAEAVVELLQIPREILPFRPSATQNPAQFTWTSELIAIVE